MGLGLALIIVAGIAAFCFMAVLGLVAFIVVRTGETSGLRDVAVVLRAYRPPLPKWPAKERR